MAFAGTNQKCTACEKTVYLVDKLTADNRIYHKSCFRCHHCNGTLKLGNYTPSRESSTAGHTLISPSKELAALTEALRVK